MSAEPLLEQRQIGTAEAELDHEKTLVDAASRKVYRFVADGIESIGGADAAAGIIGIDRSDLRKSLDRNGRRLAVEHAMALAARLSRYNATLATKIGFALVSPIGLGVFPLVTMTDKERADRLEALVLRMPLGEQLIAEALGVKR